MSDSRPSPPPPDPDPDRIPSVDDGVVGSGPEAGPGAGGPERAGTPDADPTASRAAGNRTAGTSAPQPTPPAETSATQGLGEKQPPVWQAGSRVAVVLIIGLTVLAAAMFLVMALVIG